MHACMHTRRRLKSPKTTAMKTPEAFSPSRGLLGHIRKSQHPGSGSRGIMRMRPQVVPSCQPHNALELHPGHADHTSEHHDQRENRAGELPHVRDRHFSFADLVGRAADRALELGRCFRLEPLHQAVVVHCHARCSNVNTPVDSDEMRGGDWRWGCFSGRGCH